MLRRALVPLAACLAALAASEAGTAHAAERVTPEGAPVPELAWRSCEDGFECATAHVPLDHARPHGSTVALDLVRRPAVDRERRIGTLFINPGGPGSSAVRFVRTAPPLAFQAVSRFDVVGFEQRGVGASRPAVDCDEPAEVLPRMTPATLHLPTLLRRARASSRLCLNRERAFLAGLTTGNVARDLDLLRAAVGDEQLTYLGFSYGGMIGSTYASLFPGRARALVLDSPIDADVWLNRPLDATTEQHVGFEASLDRFFTACAADQATCRFGGSDPERAFDDLLARLETAPLEAGDGRRVHADDLREAAAESMYTKRAWRPLAAALAGLQAGDARAFLELERVVADPPLLLDVFDTYSRVERRFPRSIAPYLRWAEHQFAIAPHLAHGSYEDVELAFWPVRPQGAFSGPFRHAPDATPALVIHTTNDPATPFAWGERVVRDLRNARLLTYRGDGHGVVTELDPCILAPFVAYLEDGTLPPEGASCDQDVPFGAARATATARQLPAWSAR